MMIGVFKFSYIMCEGRMIIVVDMHNKDVVLC